MVDSILREGFFSILIKDNNNKYLRNYFAYDSISFSMKYRLSYVGIFIKSEYEKLACFTR